MNDPKGSLWRKWDLHFHTPSSYDYQGGSVTNEEIIQKLKEQNIAAVAITDHHFMDVDRINELKDKAKGEIVIFPGIELRSELGGSDSIHYIGIFPEDSDSDIKSIWTKLQGNLNLTSNDITAKGGERIYCDLKEASKLIHGLGGIVSIHAGNKTNTIENITNALPYKQALKEDILELIDIFEMGSMRDLEEYEKHVLPNINKRPPMIICSDNHNINSYELKSNLWIKADPTFKGLQQTLYEPRERVYVGDTPPVIKRVNTKKTKYIKTIKNTKRTDSAYDEEAWFKDISIDLNPELVAIIGNKGNGKSALADIIGLVGNSKNCNQFSFLHKEKFRDTKNNKAEHFEGLIEWEGGNIDGRPLSENPEEYDYEKVKYFPQKYLEILCSAVQKDEFEKELKNVIFSHVPEEDKLGKTSLDDLIQYQSKVIDDAVLFYKEALNNLNKEIVCLEDLLDEEYKKTLDEKLKSKQNELKVHEKSKPIETKKPETDEKVEKEINGINLKLQNLSKLKIELEKEIADEKTKRAILIKKKASIARVYGEIDNFKSQYKSLVTKINTDLNDLEIKLEDIVTFKISTTHLDKAKENVESQITVINNKLNAEISESLVYRLTNVNLKINELNEKLDEPNRRYQEYLKQLEEWENKRKEIVGEKEKDGSIEYCKSMLDYIASTVPEELKSKRLKRLEMLRQIYRKKKELIEIFKSLYKPVETFVSKYKSENCPVKFDAAFDIQDFHENFFSHVSQKAKGSFSGVEDGSKRLRGIIESTDFNNEEAAIKCIEQIVGCMEHDQRDDKREIRNVKQQLLKRDVHIFYNFLFSLNYLVPRYTLKLGETELSQLSPGEKGALLLIFYLLIDKNDVPLVMDQPEENLDNQSVYELLVHYIKEAKKRRQIVIVTHNPNLAVVCDAEQVIYAKIDKTNRNTVSYKSGSIENTEINKKIVDVLEGTMPAFSNRESKYTITRKLSVS